MWKPFSKYNDLTVAELKEKLKSKNLPVSGTKNILIERLEENDVLEKKENPTSSKKKIKFKCAQCATKLKIPKSYNGKRFANFSLLPINKHLRASHDFIWS